jgi:hypothetical protein
MTVRKARKLKPGPKTPGRFKGTLAAAVPRGVQRAYGRWAYVSERPHCDLIREALMTYLRAHCPREILEQWYPEILQGDVVQLSAKERPVVSSGTPGRAVDRSYDTPLG